MSFKNIDYAKSKVCLQGKIYKDEMEKDEFLAIKGWFDRFMKRHGLSLRRKTSVVQKDPDMLIGKLVSYIFANTKASYKLRLPIFRYYSHG